MHVVIYVVREVVPTAVLKVVIDVFVADVLDTVFYNILVDVDSKIRKA